MNSGPHHRHGDMQEHYDHVPHRQSWRHPATTHALITSQGHHSQGALSAEGNGGGGEGQDEPGSAPYLFSARSLRSVSNDKATNGTSETHQTPTLQKQRADSYWQTVHPLGPCLQLVTEDTSTGHHGQRRRRRGAHLRTSTRSTSHARTHLRSITHATPQRAASPLLKLTGRGRPAQTTGSARARAC